MMMSIILVVRENSMFEESARSINLLTGSLTGDLQAINQQVDNLQVSHIYRFEYGIFEY